MRDLSISKPGPAVWSVLLLASMAAGLGWRIYRVRRVRYARINECQSKYAYLVDHPEKMTCECVALFQLCCALLRLELPDNIANEILKVSHFWVSLFA